MRKLREANEALSKELYILENRIANVLQHIGLQDLDELEVEIHDHPLRWKLDSILAKAHNPSPKKSTDETRSEESREEAITRDEFEELKHQVNLLRTPLGNSRKAKWDCSSQ